MRKYLIVIEKTGPGYSAYSPDLDGCVSAGRTLEETGKLLSFATATTGITIWLTLRSTSGG